MTTKPRVQENTGLLFPIPSLELKSEKILLSQLVSKECYCNLTPQRVFSISYIQDILVGEIAFKMSTFIISRAYSSIGKWHTRSISERSTSHMLFLRHFRI